VKEISKKIRILFDGQEKALESAASHTSRAAERETVGIEELGDAAHYQVTKFYLVCGL
jgi:hypothetical protein